MIQHNANSSLMIYYPAFAVKFYIIPAVETSVSENITQLQSLIWGLFIFHWNLHLSSWFSPRFFLNHTLLTCWFLNLKLIISYSVLGPSFNLAYILFIFSVVSDNLISDIRIHQIINFFLKLHLPFSDKTHVKHPLFIVFIL